MKKQILMTAAIFCVMCKIATAQSSKIYSLDTTINFNAYVYYHNKFYVSIPQNSNQSNPMSTAGQFACFDTSGMVLWNKNVGQQDTFSWNPPFVWMDKIFPVTENGQDYMLWGGYTDYFSPGTNLVYVVKTNSVGDTVWTHVYGGTSGAAVISFCLATDSNYIFSLASGEGTIIKADKNTGDTLWAKKNTYQLFGNYAIENTGIIKSSNSFYVNGIIYPVSWINFMLMKTDTLGQAIWVKAYGDSTANRCNGFTQCHDGGFLLVGGSSPVVASYGDFLVVRTDANGDTLWCRRYDHNHWFDVAGSAIETNDHGFIICGHTTPVGNPNLSKTLLIKIDSLGNPLWAKISGNRGGAQMQLTSNGEIIFLSEYIEIMDSLGNNCLSQPDTVTMGYPQMHITNITTTPGQGMGYSFRPYSYESSYPITITNYCDFTNVPEIKEPENEISVYPNPTKDELTVSSQEFGDNVQIEISDITGREILSQKKPTENCKLKTVNLTPGIYFVKVTTDKGSVVRKFIKQ